MIEEFGLGSFKFERRDKPGQIDEKLTKDVEEIKEVLSLIANTNLKEEE